MLQQIQQYFLRDSHLLWTIKIYPFQEYTKDIHGSIYLLAAQCIRETCVKQIALPFYPGVDNDPDGDSKINVPILPKIKLAFNKCLVIIFSFRRAGTS